MKISAESLFEAFRDEEEKLDKEVNKIENSERMSLEEKRQKFERIGGNIEMLTKCLSYLLKEIKK